MKNSAHLCRTAFVSAGIGLLYLTACNKHDKPEPADTIPVITSFSPTEAAEGATVVITGKNFSPDKSLNAVSFNGKAATVTEVKATELSVTVPEEATNGKITVKVGDESATSAMDFKVNASAPSITSFTPDQVDIGSDVTITGTRFLNTSKVYFNGTQATNVTFESKTTLRAKVPTGATTGKLKVINGTLEAISATNFYLRPTITSFAPEKQEEGKVITIEGNNFSTEAGGNKVSFGTVEASEVTPVSATQIKVKVPAGVNMSATIKVNVHELETSSPGVFFLLPTIISCSPDHGTKGAYVTITGKNLSPDATVYYNNTNITQFESDRSTTKITFRLLADAVESKITIKQHNVSIEAGTFMTTDMPVKISRSPFTNNRYRLEGISFVANNKIYIGWGLDGNTNALINEAFAAYDLTTQQWSQYVLPPATIEGRRYAVARELGGKVYLGTGYNGVARLDSWYRLDPVTNTWTTMAKFPTPSIGASLEVINNKLIMGCGSTESSKMYEFDESGTGSWTEKINMPIAMQHTASFVLNNKLHAGVGGTPAGLREQTIYSIDGAGVVTPETRFPGEFGIATSFVYKGSVYLIEYTGKMYRYRPDAPVQWQIVGTDFQTIFRAHVINNKVYLISKYDEVFEYVPDF